MRTFVNMFVVQSRHNSLTDLDKTLKIYNWSWLEIAYLNRLRTKSLNKFLEWKSKNLHDSFNNVL